MNIWLPMSQISIFITAILYSYQKSFVYVYDWLKVYEMLQLVIELNTGVSIECESKVVPVWRDSSLLPSPVEEGALNEICTNSTAIVQSNQSDEK